MQVQKKSPRKRKEKAKKLEVPLETEADPEELDAQLLKMIRDDPKFHLRVLRYEVRCSIAFACILSNHLSVHTIR